MHYHVTKTCPNTLKSLFTNSGEEAHGCIDKGGFITTELGGNLASKSVSIQKLVTKRISKSAHQVSPANKFIH